MSASQRFFPVVFWISLISLFHLSPPAAFSTDPASAVMEEIRRGERIRILGTANFYMDEKPETITSVSCERSAGGMHDYFSEGDYWWPDPDRPEGPYIRRDGMSNPGNFQAHRLLLLRFSIRVPALTAAYVVSADEKYIGKALEHLRAWFINAETRMNPHLLYAQAIKGRASGRGIGIIDTIHLVEVARSVQVMAERGVIPRPDLVGIREWFRQYLGWIFTHEYGVAERDNGNNHSTCWNMQVAAYASLAGDEEKIVFCRNFFKETLIPKQMAEDGSFPREVARTKPYGYSLFNLDMMVMNCLILSTPLDNLWEFTTADGKNLRRAMEFMYPYILDKSHWPFPPDVMYDASWPVQHPSLLFAGLVYQDSRFIELWKKLNPVSENHPEEVIRNFPIRQPVLWLED